MEDKILSTGWGKKKKEKKENKKQGQKEAILSDIQKPSWSYLKVWN